MSNLYGNHFDKNFAGVGNREVYEFCEKEGIPIIMEIPYNRRIAELYSRGIPFIYEMPEWGLEFQRVLDRIREQIA